MKPFRQKRKVKRISGPIKRNGIVYAKQNPLPPSPLSDHGDDDGPFAKETDLGPVRMSVMREGGERGEILSSVPQEANTAIESDTAKDFEGAIKIYKTGRQLLQQVPDKTELGKGDIDAIVSSE